MTKELKRYVFIDTGIKTVYSVIEYAYPMNRAPGTVDILRGFDKQTDWKFVVRRVYGSKQ